VPTDPTAYVSLVSIPSERFPYGRVYRLLRTDSFIAGMRTRFLNVEPELLDQAAIASLKDGRPLAMACDVMQNFPRHIEDFKYVLSTDAVDVDGLFGIDLSMSRTDMLDLHETSLTHAMTFQGVELDGNGSPKAWRVENSWGKDAGKDGYLIMSADWFHLYGGEIDVRREYVPTELLDSWDDESQDIEVEPWSSMGRALGAGRRD
jgi:bleomycin hydrolase